MTIVCNLCLKTNCFPLPRYIFSCNAWLAVEYGEGLVERVVPVCDGDNIGDFNTRLAMNANFNMTEDHLWMSMFLRPQESAFTRVQRVYCIFALLTLTMITNAMFFKSSDEEDSTEQVSIGNIKFSLSAIYVSLIGIIISTPPIILVTLLFRKSKPRITQQHLR